MFNASGSKHGLKGGREEVGLLWLLCQSRKVRCRGLVGHGDVAVRMMLARCSFGISRLEEATVATASSSRASNRERETESRTGSVLRYSVRTDIRSY